MVEGTSSRDFSDAEPIARDEEHDTPRGRRLPRSTPAALKPETRAPEPAPAPQPAPAALAPAAPSSRRRAPSGASCARFSSRCYRWRWWSAATIT